MAPTPLVRICCGFVIRQFVPTNPQRIEPMESEPMWPRWMRMSGAAAAAADDVSKMTNGARRDGGRPVRRANAITQNAT